jgi:hypothetical protein
MTKEEFYKNRILWKAKSHKLFERRCIICSDLTDMQTVRIESFAPRGIPILVFWSDENLWTVLTTEEVMSFHDESLHRMNLDKINQNIEIKIDENSEDPKRSTDFLLLGHAKVKIWVFAGEELFALYNTLRMFPLRHSDQ